MKYYLYVIKIDYSYKRDLTKGILQKGSYKRDLTKGILQKGLIKGTYKREGVVGGTYGSPT
jgi:hypothetical protein